MKKPVDFIQAFTDRKLIGAAIRGDLDSWSSWITCHKVMYGLPLDESEAALYYQCTGRTTPPTGPFYTAFLVVGRRGRKTFMSACDAAYNALFVDWRPYLGPGERVYIVIVAVDRGQCRVFMDYLKGILQSSPLLKKHVKKIREETVELDTGVTIEIFTASFRSSRGRSICLFIAEETAFWRTDDGSANPDVAIFNAIRPSLLTLPGSRLIAISTPYAKQGILWETYKEHWGKNESDTLVWVAPSLLMNSNLDARKIEAEIARDPAANSSEYLALWRDDLTDFLTVADIEQCIVSGRCGDLPYTPGCAYVAFTDASGGTGNDEFCLSIGSNHGKGKLIIDVLRASKEKDVYAVCDGYAAVARQYGCQKIYGDRYAASWTAKRFEEGGLEYVPSEWSKSDLYIESLPILRSGRVELPEDHVLINQFRSLLRRSNPSGRDSIDHPRGGRDDRANVVSGCIAYLKRLESAPVAWELPYETSTGRTSGSGIGRKSENDLWLETEQRTAAAYEMRKRSFLTPIARKEPWERDF